MDAAAYQRYLQASRYLDEGLIRVDSVPEPPARWRPRSQWMADFLPRLGHPERSFGAIHVGGTSGKGSVSMMIAELLRAAGVRAGLHVTPYLQLATEKLWADGRYASVDELVELIEWIRPHAEACRGPEVPMHGMASVAITLEHFRRAAVELGVIEVGVGGRHDLTNVLDTRVAVVTSVGLDHVKTLGPTIESIAWHKAGIIKPGCRAVVLASPGLPAAQAQAAASAVPLRVVSGEHFRACTDGPEGRVRLDFVGRQLRLEGVELAMSGAFQAENAALALAAVEELELEGLTEAAARAALARARLPGRGEWMPAHDGPRVLLDGAHNPDKLAALARGLAQGSHERLHLVYGGLRSHPPAEQLRQLAAAARTVVMTEPQVYCKPAFPAAELAASVAGCAAEVGVEPDPEAALDLALARATPRDLVLVTGSLYLVGALRDRWYPAARVLSERTSWPSEG